MKANTESLKAKNMKTLKKSSSFYLKVLEHFRKQYKDIKEITHLYVTEDNKICGGEWVNSQGLICLGDSVDRVETIKII